MSNNIKSEHIIDYFSSINPIAYKIQNDINEIKLSYEHIWNSLDLNEQINILNETIIKPEISLKYYNQHHSTSSSGISSSTVSLSSDQISEQTNQRESLPRNNKINLFCNFDGKNLLTFFNIKTGRKIVNDDHIGNYYDEHSTPFTYKTKSQINLLSFPKNFSNQETTNKHIAHKKLIKELNEINLHKFIANKNKIGDDFNKINPSATLSTLLLTTNNSSSNNLLNQSILSSSTSLALSPTNHVPQLPNYSLAQQNNETNSCDIGDCNDIFGCDDEENLVSNISFGMNSSSSVPSEEDEEKNYEFKSLLEHTDIRKGYDFLANW